MPKHPVCHTLTFILLLLLPCTGSGQGELGGFLGIANYQGDLASISTVNGFQLRIHPVIGLHAGYAFSDHLQLRGQLYYTRLSGDDALASSEPARQRNLNFNSVMVHFTTGVEWYPFGFSASEPGRIAPYAAAAGGIFYFNPTTTYEGATIPLQPLGTEGQFLDDYPEQKPYHRIQPGISTGGGFKLATGNDWILTLEAMLTFTFTDYLDDVSTIYIEYPELLEKAGPLTAALANRQGEYLGTDPVVTPTGSARGNPETKDLFGVISLRLSVPIEIRSSRYKVRLKQQKTIRCPKF